jgi:putative SOS response-associated peptidase YedK
MCGRTSSYTPPQRLAEVFEAQLAPDLDPDGREDGPLWNVGPTNNLFGLTAPVDGSGPLVLDDYRWGLIPWWSKDRSPGNRLFNARFETIATKPAFRQAFTARRLAVVVDGFFEWRRAPGRKRQPFYFHRGDGYPLAFAGLWEAWRDPDTATWLRSCTIITTTAGPDMDGIHDRMPVVLERERLAQWLQPGAGEVGEVGEPDVMALLRPAAAGTLVCYPVGDQVGNVRNDTPELLRPVEAAGTDEVLRLFD